MRQIKQKEKQQLTIKEDQKKDELPKFPHNKKITAAGIGNAALGIAAVDLTKKLLTPEHKRNATKEDIRKLSSLVKGQRYFPVNNIEKDQFGRKPFYDIETANIVFQ